jgi:alpha-tubulin suppressor-like RCC1 family protein
MSVCPLLGSVFDARHWAKFRCLWLAVLSLLAVPGAEAALSATFNAATDVAVTTASYTPAGEVDFTLNFAPEPGTNLTVVKNTGLPFMDGTFSNLANGATVNLSYDGKTYPFVAWYYGGEGNNDLVLLWPYMKIAAWGRGSEGAMGNSDYSDRPAAVSVSQSVLMADKTIVQVVASNGTSYALTTQGRVYAWGSNANGKLGIDSTSFSWATPQVVIVSSGISALFGKTVVSIAGGATHCLALCSDGTVVSWGNNAEGQLGDNTTTQRLVPVLVNAADGVSALSGKKVVAIAAGESHSLALCSDGTITSWGSNTSGQLGTVPSLSSRVPVPVDTAEARSALFGKSVASIDAGANHNLALCTDGTLVAWGSNASGELGDDSTALRYAPVLVTTNAGSAVNGRTVTSISAGGASSLALCSDGTLAAWGSNSHGQLGNGSTTPRQAPFRVSADSGSALEGKLVVSIEAGGTHSLALCSDGTLVTWGSNDRGQLGDNSSVQRLLPVTVNAVQGVSFLAGSKVRQISQRSGSQDHSLGVFGMPQERMIIKGNSIEVSHQDTTPSLNDHTDFGHANLHGMTVSRTFTIVNEGLASLNLTGSPRVAVTGTNAADFTVTSQPFSALQSKETRTFTVRFDPTGVGIRNATLSIPNNTTSSNPFTFAIQGSSADPEFVLEQPAGTEINKGSTRDFGELAPGGNYDRPFVIRNTGGDGSLLSGLQVTLSGANASDFSIIGTVSSTLVGPNSFTNFVVRFRPQTVGIKTATLSIANNDTDENPYQIQLTGSAPISLSATFNGASDVGVTLNGLKASAIPLNLNLNFAPEPGTNLTVVKNTGLAHIDGIFANMANGATVNLSYNGTNYPFVAWYYGGEGNNDLVLLWPRTGLASWGDNARGQLGDGTTTGKQVPGAVEQSAALLGKTIVQIARGHDFALALTSEGQVFSWGDHSSGQLGTGGALTSRSLPAAITSFLTNKKVICIAAGHSHALALCSDNTLWAWGPSSQGRLGNGGTSGIYYSPTEVSRYSSSTALQGKTVVSIAAGGQHSLALCSDGTLAAWGSNLKGQLGMNSTAQQNEPKAVSQASEVSALFGKTVTAISAGTDHSMALCSDGTVVTWGGNDFGQLGINSTANSLVPVLVSTTEGVSALSGRTVVSMMAAGTHSRALCSDGAFIAWGSNSAGNLGDGTMTDRLVPVMVNAPGGGTLQGRSIVAFTSSQALCSDGTLAAWGNNASGQVGDNTTVDRLTPVSVNVDSGMSVLAGRKISGLCGPGLSTSPSLAIYGKPLVSKIGVKGNSIDIAHDDTTPSMGDHTDFVGANVANGTVVRTFTIRNWEYLPLNLTGSPKVEISGLHASEFTVTTQPASPVSPFTGANTFQITFDPAALGERSAVVSIASDDPDLPAFSFNILGRGVDPELVIEQPAGTGLAENELRDFRKVPVGAGKNLTFTVKNTGAAGSQLKDFSTTLDGASAGDFSVTTSPVAPVDGPSGLTTFTVRFSPTAPGIKTAVLHLVSSDPDDSPFDIQLTGEGATHAVFNEAGSAAFETDHFIAAGATLNTMLNFAPAPGTSLTVIKNTGPSFIQGTFANVPNGGSVNLTYNGTTYPFVAWYYGGEGNNDLVLLWAKTSLGGWGKNDQDQLTYMTSFPSWSPQLKPVLVDRNQMLEGKTIVQVAQGKQHCLALTTEGKVYSWGEYSYLGRGYTNSNEHPYEVQTGRTVIAIAAASTHSLALCSDGTIMSWGGYSQSYPATVNNWSSALTGKVVTEIAAGQNHDLALCSDGTVVAWGTNTSGQLGNNSQTASSTPVAVNVSPGVSALSGKIVRGISAGESHSLALCTDGTVVAWGNNVSGQLGDNTTTTRLVPVLASTESGTSALYGRVVTHLAAGGSHNLALCADGTVVAWGGNGDGQLGDGSQTNRLSPVAVNAETGTSALAGKTVMNVSAGATHSLALCSDNTMVSWGRNADGQLGDNTQISRSVPVQVNAAEGVSVLAGLNVIRLAAPMSPSESSIAVISTKPADIVVYSYVPYPAVGPIELIEDGDSMPSQTKRTDFGAVEINSSVQNDFRLWNRGFEVLRLTGSSGISVSGQHAGDFSVIPYTFPPYQTTPLTSFPNGAGTTFKILFRPIGLGVRTAKVTITSNDPAKGSYDFVVQGTGVTPEIEIRESGANVPHSSTFAFGEVAVDSHSFEKTFVINNLGTSVLKGYDTYAPNLTVTKFGNNAADFIVLTQPAGSIGPGESTSFTVQARPGSSGTRKAALQIGNNDLNEGFFLINLTVEGSNSIPPTAAKESVTGVTFDAATLKAEVSAKDYERRVFFEYGTTGSYGMQVTATPGTVTGSTPSQVSAVLTGLLPNTTYHFRAKVEGPRGSAFSKSKTFTTLNRPPVALADSAVVLPGGQVVIPVLVNDVDVGDVLNIASFTQPPAAVGKVTKVGNTLVFTAAAAFAGGTFSYVAGDAHKGKSGPATVALTPGTCTIGPDVTVPSDSPPYELAVTANAPFGVIENVAWLSFVPPAANATSVTIIPAPNASKTERTATILVGGKAHKVTQSGVSELPALTVPAPIPLAAISSSYELAIPTQNGPVTYTATGLPKGLTLSNVTGKITGYPTEAKTSTVTVKAKNVRGESNTISFDITVLGIPASVVGSHSAVIGGSEVLTDKLGGLMTMTVTSAGGVSGTLKLGTGSHGFTGRLNTAEDPAEPDPEHAVMRTTVKRTGKPSLELLVRMNEPEEDRFSAELTLPGAEPVTVEMMGGHHVWDAKAKPAQNHDGYYTMALQPTSTAAGIPQGDGFLTMTVTPAGGVKWSGQLADGTVISAQTSALWADGRVPLFAVFGKGVGSLTQTVTIAAGARGVTGPLRWHKKPQAVRAYADGFEAATLQAVGGKYAPPLPGKTLLNQPAPFSYLVYFLGSGIEAVRNFTDLDQLFTMNTKHVISMTGMNPAQVKITKMDVALGTFTGTMALKDTNPFNASLPEAARTVTFQGVVVPSIFMGTGYFLLPGITGPPLNVKTSAMTSGEVRISAQN